MSAPRASRGRSSGGCCKSPSITSSEPVCFAHIRSAAAVSESDGDSVTLARLITSETFTDASVRGSGFELVPKAPYGQ